MNMTPEMLKTLPGQQAGYSNDLSNTLKGTGCGFHCELTANLCVSAY